MELTNPIKITKKEYASGVIAIDKQTAEHWLILSDGQHFYVGTDVSSLQTTMSESYAGKLNAHVEEVDVTGSCGEPASIEAYVIKTGDCYNEVDLEELANGHIAWK